MHSVNYTQLYVTDLARVLQIPAYKIAWFGEINEGTTTGNVITDKNNSPDTADRRIEMDCLD